MRKRPHFYIYFILILFVNPAVSQNTKLDIRQVKCLDYDTLDYKKEIVFILNYKSKTLPLAIHQSLDSIICLYVDTLDKVKQPPVIYIINESKFTKKWSDSEIMRNNDHLYSNKLYFFAKYSWNKSGEFISKVDNNHQIVATKLDCLK
ncbi:MAG: hypothetical protein WAT43_19305 [Chitinophagales bacterium]|nr:hypothetical protein [Bacteroidota bacterium]